MGHVESQEKNSKASQDFDLNLAPIIDCLVVLIAFLMVSLSYISIQMIDAGMTASGGLSQTVNPNLSLEFRVESESQVALSIKEKGKKARQLSFSMASIESEVSTFLTSLPESPESALINAHDQVSYEWVIKTLDAVKTHIPQVQLSGF
jgi:biopolymer transport protein ExbD